MQGEEVGEMQETSADCRQTDAGVDMMGPADG